MVSPSGPKKTSRSLLSTSQIRKLRCTGCPLTSAPICPQESGRNAGFGFNWILYSSFPEMPRKNVSQCGMSLKEEVTDAVDC
jgi:hypothetical protein